MSKKRKNALEESLGLLEIEKTPFERFYEKPKAYTLSCISKYDQTPEIAKIAVENDGLALKEVYKRLITPELCKIAVCQNGMALNFVPQKYKTSDIISAAVSQNGMAIQFVPLDKITRDLAEIAVGPPITRKTWEKCPISYIPSEIIDEKLVQDSIKYLPQSLGFVPEEYINKELLQLAVSCDGAALEYVPKRRMGKKLIDIAISNCPCAIKFVPETKITEELCDKVFELDKASFAFIPDRFKNKEMCLTFIDTINYENGSHIFDIKWIPDSLRNDKDVINAIIDKFGVEFMLDWNEKIDKSINETKPLSRGTLNYLKSRLPVIETTALATVHMDEAEIADNGPDTTLVKDSGKQAIIHDLTENDEGKSEKVYYISDIHLEHQLIPLIKKEKISIRELDDIIDKKVSEMLEEVDLKNIYSFNISAKNSNYILIAGDVGYHKELVTRFYDSLSRSLEWQGKIISVLGNHELWDDHPEYEDGYAPRTVDDIVNDYRERISSTHRFNCKLLHNELFIKYKGKSGFLNSEFVISEEQILTATDEDLREVLQKSSFIILGGIGFSGLNRNFNANSGLYRSTVMSIEKDIELTEKFRKVYEKVKRCAEDMRVIVLTHTQVSDWTNEPYVPKWVYINGHTHRNTLIRKIDGTTVLSDNQVGYKPTKLKLNAFTIKGWYDPFKYFEDGIHKISPEEYKDFYNGRGISIRDKRNDGVRYVLKRNNMYMFLLKSDQGLFLLVGGTRNRLYNYEINYYYDNLIHYAEKVKMAMSPYHSALKKLGDEIKRIGGEGNVHGCIVDIDYFCHAYLNPFDGKITFYYAIDIKERFVYNDLTELIEKHRPKLMEKYKEAYNKGSIPLLSRYAITKENKNEIMKAAIVPKLVLGTEIYKGSRIMRAIQYIFDENVIRVWNDEILYTDFNNNLSIEG